MQAAERSAQQGPLASDELEAAFAAFATAKLIALAVSGGADSLALLDGIDRWRRKRGRPNVIVLTVDHRLRRGSGREAAMVKRVAASRGLPARVLVRKGPHPKSDVESAARAARYALLLAACRDIGATHLVLAHHRDDVAETFLMRLKRGAGVFGLAAMRPSIAAAEVTIVRPFLGVPRDRLAATTAAAAWTPVSDPMNSDPRYERAKARMLLAEGDLDPAQLAAIAVRFTGIAEAIDARATALIGDAVVVDDFAIAWLDARRFAAAPREVRNRVLVRLLLAVGGDDYPPRFERLSTLADSLLAHDGKARFKRTLAGTVIEWRGGRFAFYREFGRTGLASLRLKPGFRSAWDHRFAVEVGRRGPPGLTLGPLGEADRREVGATSGRAPVGALLALPAVRKRGRIVAVPALGEGSATLPVVIRQIVAERLRRPPLFPDFEVR